MLAATLQPDQATDLTVSASALTGLTGSLLIEASRNLTVDAALGFTKQTAGNSVTMLAGSDLTVNQPISTQGGSLILRAAVQTDGTTTFDGFNGEDTLEARPISVDCHRPDFGSSPV